MASREHRNAVTRMLRASGLLQVPEEAPLVALVKSLAKELDEGGGSRAYTAYLSALKDVRRVLAAAPGSAGASVPVVDEKDSAVAVEPDGVEPEVADFESFRRAKGSAAPGAG